MKKNKRKSIVILLVVAVLLGIGYAAVSGVTLNITGSASASKAGGVTDPETDKTFNVEFTGSPTTEKKGFTVAKISDEHTAGITVSGLTSTEQEAYAIYTVENTSDEADATVAVSIENENSEVFEVTTDKVSNTFDLAKGETTTVKVTIKLKKTVTEDTTGEVNVKLNATPKE